MNEMNFGDRIKNERLKRNLKQEEVARQFNVSVSTISHWESGSRYPDLEMLRKIADYYALSTDELLSREDYIRIPERTPVMESRQDNMIEGILFGCLMMIYLFRIMLDHTVVNDLQGIEFYLFEDYSILLISILGIIKSVKREFNPKIIGLLFIIIMMRFFVEWVVRYIVSVRDFGFSWKWFYYYCIDDFVFPIIYSIATYLFYFKEKEKMYWIILFLTIALFLHFFLGGYLEGLIYWQYDNYGQFLDCTLMALRRIVLDAITVLESTKLYLKRKETKTKMEHILEKKKEEKEYEKNH